MNIEEIIAFLSDIASNEIIDIETSDALQEIENKIQVINDFGVNGFALDADEICELYTSVRSDLVEKVKNHDKRCREILKKAKF